MSNNIFEELPSRKGGEAQPGADAAAGIEKRARQLVYDARYEVKKMLAGKKADPASQERMVLQRIAKSTAIPAVKTRARQMVSKKAAVAEDFIPSVQDAAANSVAKAMFKVFVEGVEQVIPDYLDEMNGLDDKKYKIRVTDPKTGNSYVRYGTREKITQLRAKGLKVEMTEYGDPREGERKRGESTAKALGGGRGKKKLDPVGREDGDVDNDGDRDKSDKYLMKRRKAIGKAIATRTEEFLADGTDSTEGQNKDKITGKGVDNYSNGIVKVSPEDGTQIQTSPKNVYAHTEVEGELIAEKAMSKAQQRFMGMVYARKKGEMKKGEASPEVEAAAKGMTKKEAKKFAKTKHKGLPEKVEEAVTGGSSPTLPPSVIKFVDELPQKIQQTFGGAKAKPSKPKPQVRTEAAECGSDDKEKERDTRGDYAKINMVKNKLRAMGAKNPIVMVASEETVEEGRALGRAGRDGDDNPRGAAVRASSGRGMTMTPARGLGASKPEGSDEERRKKHADQVRSDRRAAARERSETGEDRLGRLIRSVQKDNYELEGKLVDEARAEEKRGLESTGEQRKKQRTGVVTSSGEVAHPATSYSGGQNPHLRGKEWRSKEERRQSSRRYVDQPGGVYAKPENKQGEGRYAAKQARKRPDLGSRFD